MDKLNLITKVATYLIDERIMELYGKLPDSPSFQDNAPYLDEIWSKLHSKQLTSIGNKIESIEKIRKHGVIAIGEISLVKDDYHVYVTSRIHEFAEYWLDSENKKAEELNKVLEKRNKYKSFRDTESFQDDEYEWASNQMEMETLEYFGFEEWEELMEVVKTISNFAFKSSSYPQD